MAEVKWIKISTGLFDDEAIQIILDFPDGAVMLEIWLRLLILAGKCNDQGAVYFKENIPYSVDLLATVFKKKNKQIELALQTFSKFNMIKILDNQQILIQNWEKYQNLEELEKIRKQNRERVKKHRNKQKLLTGSNVTCNVTVTQSNGTDIEVEEDIDKEVDINIDSDYLLTRSAYRTALQQIDEIEIVFDFGTFTECTKFLERSAVDAILIDIRLSDMEYQLIKELQHRYKNTKFIVMTEQDELLQVIALGAAYILKDITLEEFVMIIDTILRGNLFIAACAVEVLQKLVQEKLVIKQEVAKFHLTERELEILNLVIKGESNSEIGDELCLSQFTVKNYVSRIIEKLKVKTRTEATAKAIQLGLVS